MEEGIFFIETKQFDPVFNIKRIMLIKFELFEDMYELFSTTEKDFE